MCSIYWRKISLTLLAVIFCLGLFGQSGTRSVNYMDFKNKPYYFGLSVGYNNSSFKLNHSEAFILNDSFRISQPQSGPGIHIGIITNLKIGEYFDFRAIPGFSFVERNIEYTAVGSQQGTTGKPIESVFVEAPFLLRFKSTPYRDMRVFVVSGVKYSYDVANNSRTRQANSLIKISPHEYTFEVGAGVQFFFPYFIFSPELKFTQGISNILIYNDQLEKSTILDRLLSRTFSFTLHFEG